MRAWEVAGEEACAASENVSEFMYSVRSIMEEIIPSIIVVHSPMKPFEMPYNILLASIHTKLYTSKYYRVRHL